MIGRGDWEKVSSPLAKFLSAIGTLQSSGCDVRVDQGRALSCDIPPIKPLVAVRGDRERCDTNPSWLSLGSGKVGLGGLGQHISPF